MKIVIAGLFFHRPSNKHKRKNNRTFPGFNDFVEASGKSVRTRNNMKEKYQKIIVTLLQQQATQKIKGKAFFFYDFYEPDMRRDPSNIAAFFIKIFEDALQVCGLIDNDGWNTVLGYACYFHVDHDNPRIEVTIEERE